MRINRRVFGAICAAAVLCAAVGAGGQTYTVERKSVVQDVVKPVEVVRREDGVFFVDFGRAAFGALEIEVGALQEGKKVTVRLGEIMEGKDHVNRKPDGSIRFLEAGIVEEAGKKLYRPALTKNDGRLMAPEVGAVMPFRYVELEGMPEGTTAEGLKAGGVRQLATHYPFEDGAAEFACANEKLNAIWGLCKYSMKATSYGRVFVDGDRERKPYEADAYINQLGWYYTTTDTTLPRYSHEYLVMHATWPTEWFMFSVMTGWADWQYTGEMTSLKVYYGDLKVKTLSALAREDGLISTKTPLMTAGLAQALHYNGKASDIKDIVDWPAGERDGYEMKDVNTVVNAFHCHALGLMAQMAGALGKTDEAAEYKKAAEKATACLNEKLVDAGTGLYVDGEGSSHSALHANMFPLAFGLVPADRREKVAAFVAGRGMACSVYGGQFLMEALFASGHGDEAMALMEAAGDRSWRHMTEDVGTTITLEAWDNKYKPNEDWNHAWGAAPANILPRYVLGVEPVEAGYAKVRIWPRAGKLAWAKGRVPTVKGTVVVDWKREGGKFVMTVELPVGVKGEVGVPGAGKVMVDGKEVEGMTQEGAIFVEVGGGKHEVINGG